MTEDGAQREFFRAAPIEPAAIASMIGYYADGDEPGFHRGLPSPYLTFVISLDDPIIAGASPEHACSADADRHEVLVAGLHMDPTYIRQPSRQVGIQLAVHPLACRALFGSPARALQSRTVHGRDLLGPDVTLLRERLQGEPTWTDRFDVLGDFLRARLEEAQQHVPVRPELREAWGWLTRRHGMGSIPNLAEHVALSRRHLQELFKQELGYTPQAIGRLMRFHQASARIAAVLAAGGELSLVETAMECGYYDHPHLVRDFQQFTGTSPSSWIGEEFPNIQAGGHRNGA